MTGPDLISGATIALMQIAARTLTDAEPQLADSRDFADHTDNISTGVAGLYGAVNRDAEPAEIMEHLLEIAAAALIAVEAVQSRGLGPRI
jgi:hypothetical protein